MAVTDWPKRARELCTLEFEYTVGRSDGAQVDVREVEERAAMRLHNEVISDEDRFELARLAVRAPAKAVTRSHMPSFSANGIRLKMTDVVRVADAFVVSVIHATEDDWLAYLKIKRVNAERQAAEFEAFDAGVTRIVADLRVFSGRTGIARPNTLAACPYLFDVKQEEAA